MQLIRGMYSVFLSRWLRAVPRERILAVSSEQFMNDEISILHQVRKPCLARCTLVWPNGGLFVWMA